MPIIPAVEGQTEGFLDSLLSLMRLDLKAPDHTTLSRRNKDVEVQGGQFFLHFLSFGSS